jgi:cystathionine beta-synthase
MREKGFDQLPVSAGTGSRLCGLVTLGNLLSYLSSGRATGDSRVSEVMFDFTQTEVSTNPQDISIKTPEERKKAATSSETESHPRRRQFVEITKDTKLSALSRFFEWNSAAIVTEKTAHNGYKASAVVTKVDLLTWLIKSKKQNGSN